MRNRNVAPVQAFTIVVAVEEDFSHGDMKTKTSFQCTNTEVLSSSKKSNSHTEIHFN